MKPPAGFEEKLLQLSDERGFEFALRGGLGEGEDVKNVRVFERLLPEVRLRRGKPGGEVGDGLAEPGVGMAIDLQGEEVAAPAFGERLLHVPAAGSKILDLLQQDDVVRLA